MDKANEIRNSESQDWEKLNQYLRKIDPCFNSDMKVLQFHGGHANLTYLLRFMDVEYVLRRPPFGKIAPGAHDMKREFRVLSQLYKQFSPAPRAYHFCEDNSIIGAPFVILERKTGVVIRKTIPESFNGLQNLEKRLAEALITTLSNLHKVDYKELGLSTLGKPDGYLQRQVHGWSKRWNLSQSEVDEDMDILIEWLTTNIPISHRSAIIHNDFKFDNCQFQPNEPDQITAVFDWDMCTIGDPLADLGTTLSYWPSNFKNEKNNLLGIVSDKFPEKGYLIDLYSDLTGFDVSEVEWYEVFSFWKIAIVVQQLYKRYLDGETKDERMKYMGHVVTILKKLAIQIVERK